MDKITNILSKIVGADIAPDKILEQTVDIEDKEIIKKIFAMLSYVYDEKMPFNKYLGIRVDTLDLEKVIIRTDMQKDLVGNYEQEILHGGVISAVIDLTGGIIAQANAISNMKGITVGEMAQNFAMMSTINMRVDYLRPGKGKYFLCEGAVVRTGNKVSVTRMEFYNDVKQLIAVGTGSYMVG